MSDDKIVVQCVCGKRYKASADRIGHMMKCKACGNPFEARPANEDLPEFGSVSTKQEFHAPEPASSFAPAAQAAPPEERRSWVEREERRDIQNIVDAPGKPFRLKKAKKIHLSADKIEVNPDSLMKDITEKEIGKPLSISIVCHLLAIGLLSVGFMIQYAKDIKCYNTYDLAIIRAEKKKEQEEEEKRIKKIEADKKRAEREAALKKEEEEKAKREAEEKARRGTSAVEKNVEEKILQAPTAPDIKGIDAVNELEAQ